MSKKLTDDQIVERAEFKDMHLWKYLKFYLIERAEFCDSLSRINKESETAIINSFYENNMKRKIYNELINLVEKTWPKEAEKIQKQGANHG